LKFLRDFDVAINNACMLKSNVNMDILTEFQYSRLSEFLIESIVNYVEKKYCDIRKERDSIRE